MQASLAVCGERVRKSGLLSRADCQAVVMLDFNPGNGVGTFERVERWEPSGRVLVALGLVKVVGDSDELRSSEVIGKLLAPIGSPRAGTANPGCLQWYYMILEIGLGYAVIKALWVMRTYDIEIGSQVGGYSVVRRNPVTRSNRTLGVSDDICAIPLQNG